MTEQPNRFPSVAGYEVVREIGRGGMAVVYEAVQLAVDRPVALKVVSYAHQHESALRRFRSECRTIGRLAWHPNVVSLYDAGETEEQAPYLAMELLTGGSLGDRTRATGPMSSADVVRASIEVCDALAAAHDEGVLHRDIKPDNLMVGRRGETLLADFGIAALTTGTQSATGSFIGTIAFSAPELLKGERASPTSDVYSLGATMHALLSGSTPFTTTEGDSPVALLWRVSTSAPPPLPGDVAPALAAVVDRAMDKDPALRHQSAGELMQALRDAEAAVGGGPQQGAAALPTRPPDVAPAEPTADQTIKLGPAVVTPVEAPATSVPDRLADTTHAGPPPADAPATDTTHTADTVAIDPVSTSSRGRRSWAIATAALVAMIALAAGVALSRDTGSDPADATPAQGAPATTTDTTVGDTASTTAPAPAAGDAVGAPLSVGDEPQGVVATDTDVWVADFGGGTVTRVDRATRAVAQTVAVGGGPYGIAATPDAVWIASSTNRTVIRLDPRTGQETARLDVPGAPVRVAATPEAVWVVQFALGSVARIDPATNQVVATVPVGAKPSGIATTDGAVWVSNMDDDTVVRIDPVTNQVVATIEVGAGPSGLAVASHGLWVALTEDDEVVRIDTATGSVDTPVPVGANPFAIAATDDAVWVACAHDDEVRVLSPTDPDAMQRFSVGERPFGIAAQGDEVWVTSSEQDTVTPIGP